MDAIWLSRDPLGEYAGVNAYDYVANDPVNEFDPLGLCTYEANRQLGGGPSIPRDHNPLHLLSHTFTFTTNPDGTINHTYSWGNEANLKGWNEDQPEDFAAAIDALRRGNAQFIGNSNLDPYIDAQFNRRKNPKYNHPNGWCAFNCKTEADFNLIGPAQVAAGNTGTSCNQ